MFCDMSWQVVTHDTVPPAVVHADAGVCPRSDQPHCVPLTIGPAPGVGHPIAWCDDHHHPSVQPDPQLPADQPDLQIVTGHGVTVEQEARGLGCPKLEAHLRIVTGAGQAGPGGELGVGCLGALG